MKEKNDINSIIERWSAIPIILVTLFTIYFLFHCIELPFYYGYVSEASTVALQMAEEGRTAGEIEERVKELNEYEFIGIKINGNPIEGLSRDTTFNQEEEIIVEADKAYLFKPTPFDKTHKYLVMITRRRS